MADMSMNPDVVLNAWRIATVANQVFQEQGRLSELPFEYDLVRFLLSPENQARAYFNMSAVKNELNNATYRDKLGYSVAAKFTLPYTLRNERTPDDPDDYCNFGGESVPDKTVAYNINRRTSATIKIDNSELRCTEGEFPALIARHMTRLALMAVTNLSEDVMKEFFSKTGDGRYRYIGNLPTRVDGIERPAGESLPLFRDASNAYNAINPSAEIKLDQDLSNARISEPLFALGGDVADQYMQHKRISMGTNDEGIMPGAYPVRTLRGGNFMRSERVQTYAAESGVANPLLLLRRGAAQLVTRNYNNAPNFQGDKGATSRATFVDPYLGLTWDLYEYTEVCGRDYVTYLKVEIFWGIITYPTDCFEDVPGRAGVNDIMLYNVSCGDSPVCDITNTSLRTNPFLQNFDPSCDNSLTSVCTSDCSVSLFLQEYPDGKVVAQANGTPTSGQSITQYEFFQDGISLGSNVEGFQNFSAGSLADGDIVKVIVTSTDGTNACTASAEVVFTSNLPALEIVYDGVARASGYTTSGLTYAKDSGVKNITVTLNAAGAAPVQILGVSLSNSGVAEDATMSDPNAGLYPVTLPAGYSLTLSVDTAGALTGVNTATVTIVSNDANQPSQTFNWAYTITP